MLYVSAAKGGYGEERTLARVSIDGGREFRVPAGTGMLDEFRCAAPGGRRCVLRRTENGQHIFHELDPIQGIGRELHRTAWSPFVVGDWALSPDGSEIAIPNHDPGKRLLHIVALDAPVSRTQRARRADRWTGEIERRELGSGWPGLVCDLDDG